MRVGQADRDVGLAFLEAVGDAGQRAARADGADEAVDLAVGLRPRSPAPVVSKWPRRLATLSNWLAQMAPLGSIGVSSAASRAEYFT